MKIKDLYSKNKTFPVTNIIIVITCLLVSIPTYFDTKLFNVFAFCSQPDYFWQKLTGAFEHGIVPREFLLIHLFLNMLMIVFLGMIAEKFIGSFKAVLIFFTSWIVCAIELHFIFMKFSTKEYSAGNSAVGYAFAPIGFYLIYKVIQEEKLKIFRQAIVYLYMVIFILMALVLNPNLSGYESLFLHLSGLIEGLVFLFIFKKQIDSKFEEIRSGRIIENKFNRMYLILLIIPICMLIILISYYLGYTAVLY